MSLSTQNIQNQGKQDQKMLFGNYPFLFNCHCDNTWWNIHSIIKWMEHHYVYNKLIIKGITSQNMTINLSNKAIV